MDDRELKHSARSALKAAALAQAASQLVSLGALAVLFRLLDPGDFGLLGMVVPVMVLLRSFCEQGLRVALVQREELSDAEASGCFWMTQKYGLITALVSAASAPLIAWIFGEPRAMQLAWALSGTTIVLCVGITHQALAERKLKLGSLYVARLIAQTVAAGGAIAAAVAGWQVWSLVVMAYLELVVLSAAVWIVVPWRPTWSSTRPAGVARFGSTFTAANLVLLAMQQVDKVLVGVFLGREALGLYWQAFQLAMKPVNLIVPHVTAVMLPVLSRSKAGETYRSLVGGFLRLLAILVLPCSLGLTIVAPEAIVVLGGSQWQAAGPLLQILALAIAAQAFFNCCGTLLTSQGQVRLLLSTSLIIFGVMTAGYGVGLYLGTQRGEPALGMAMAYTIGLSLGVLPIYLNSTLRAVGVKTQEALSPLRQSVIATAVMVMAVIVCRRLLVDRWGIDTPAILLGAQVAIGVAAYAFAAHRELNWLWQQYRKLRRQD